MNKYYAARYVPITHEYVIEDKAGELIARLPAKPGTDRDKTAARLFAAAPELYAALWLLLGDDETEQTAVMDEEEKRRIARDALKLAGSRFDDEKIRVMARWHKPNK